MQSTIHHAVRPQFRVGKYWACICKVAATPTGKVETGKRVVLDRLDMEVRVERESQE